MKFDVCAFAFIHRKNQVHKVLGHLLKVLSQSTGYNFSWQINYNIVLTLLQVEKICERG